MLHSLPALLDELEQRLVRGEDPVPLLGSFRWQELIDWPKSREEALAMKRRLQSLQTLISGLNAPIQATLAAFSPNLSYQPAGGVPTPRTVSSRLYANV